MRRLTLAAALLAASVPVRAAEFADLPAIDAAVAQFAGAVIGEPGGATLPVDRRLRLAACRQPLALGWNGPRRDSVVVQCPDAGGWRLFVPVASVPQVQAAAVITRGEAVTITVTGDGFSVSQPGEALDPGAVGAWIRVRTAAKGEPLRAQVVRPGLVAIPVE